MKPKSALLAGLAALVVATVAHASTPVTTLPVTIWGSGVTLERGKNWLDIVNRLYASSGVPVRFVLAGVGPTKWGNGLAGITGMTIDFPPDDYWIDRGVDHAIGLGCINSLPLWEASCFFSSLRDNLIVAAPQYDELIALVIAHEFGHNFSLDHTPGTVMSASVGGHTNFNAEQVAILNQAIPQAAVPPVKAALGRLLLNGRFTVQAEWTTKAGAQGTGKPMALTRDSGYLWFFEDSNIEVTAKVVDGCGLNERFWVFMAGMTDVGVDLTVTDFETDIPRTTKIYVNEQGKAFLPIQDTNAFATCSAGVAQSEAPVVASGPLPEPRTWVCGNL
jgi:hypothetical protein